MSVRMVMRQRWSDLLFAHWKVSPPLVRRLVPQALALDLLDGDAWVTVTPFLLSDLALRGFPALPWLSTFPELNLRTYVTLRGRPGVYFFSLDAARLMAVAAARIIFRLPYRWAQMRIEIGGDRTVLYRSRRRRSTAALECSYRPAGAVYQALPGTADHFLVERYCLYTVSANGAVYRTDIEHEPWSLQAVEARFALNTLGQDLGLQLGRPPDRTAFARSTVVRSGLPISG
ncbi:MAG: YqjF family protein [Gemmatimonadota bacterium]